MFGYWESRALSAERCLLEAHREHMRDMTALVDAAGGVIRVEATTLLHLPRMSLTISPIHSTGGVEYRRHYGRSR